MNELELGSSSLELGSFTPLTSSEQGLSTIKREKLCLLSRLFSRFFTHTFQPCQFLSLLLLPSSHRFLRPYHIFILSFYFTHQSLSSWLRRQQIFRLSSGKLLLLTIRIHVLLNRCLLLCRIQTLFIFLVASFHPIPHRCLRYVSFYFMLGSLSHLSWLIFCLG